MRFIKDYYENVLMNKTGLDRLCDNLYRAIHNQTVKNFCNIKFVRYFIVAIGNLNKYEYDSGSLRTGQSLEKS